MSPIVLRFKEFGYAYFRVFVHPRVNSNGDCFTDTRQCTPLRGEGRGSQCRHIEVEIPHMCPEKASGHM